MPNNSSAAAAATGEPESAYAWMRLLACVLIVAVMIQERQLRRAGEA